MTIKRGPFETALGRPATAGRRRRILSPSASASSSFGITGQPIRPAGTARRGGTARVGRGIQRPVRRQAAPTRRDPTTGIPIGESLLRTQGGRRTITEPRVSSRQREANEAQQNWLQDYYRQVQQQQTSARTANEQRYQQMLRITDEDYAREAGGYQAMLGTISQETGQRAADIRSRTTEQVEEYRQQQSRLGLSNVYQPSIVGGIEREGQESLNRLTDQLLGRKLGVQQLAAQQGRGKRLGIMERRTDAYPQTAGMMDLVKTIYQGFGTRRA